MDKERIQFALKTIRKEFGSDSIFVLGESMDKFGIQRWSSGIPDFDEMVGGGMPKSRVCEVWGPNQSGKTSLCYHLAAQLPFSVFIDGEGTFDSKRAELFGAKPKRMLVNRPESGEEAVRVILEFVKASVPLIIIDSVPTLVPKKQVEADIGKDSISPIPRLMSKLFHRLIPILPDSETTVLFVNQVRDRIGIVFGDPYSTPGGHALKHFAALRIEVRRKGWIGKRDTRFGQICIFRVVKSKVSEPYKFCEVPLLFDKGFVSHEQLEQRVRDIRKQRKEDKVLGDEDDEPN